MAEPFNVDGFRSALGAGGARPNQFKVAITFPSILPVTAGIGRDGQFLVTAASLPGQTIGVAGVMYRGRQVQMAGDRVFNPWTTTIINDTQFKMRNAIEQWMNVMESLESKVGNPYPASYYSDLRVEQLDRNGQTLKSYIFRGAFPVDLSDVGLDYGANDQVSTFSCTWQYQHFSRVEDANTGALLGNFVAPGINLGRR